MLARSKDMTEKYLALKRELRLKKTTIFKHLIVNSLKWATDEQVSELRDQDVKIQSSGDPLFTNANDLKIIRNDFPYFFEDDVTHLCVWSKEPIRSDPQSYYGDISEETRLLIEQYICKTFVEWLGVPRENILWFRNWDALQSVKEISHVHVIVKGMSLHQISQALGSPGKPLSP